MIWQKITLQLKIPKMELLGRFKNKNIIFLGCSILFFSACSNDPEQPTENNTTPKVEVKLAGVGEINLEGETKDIIVKISGSGNFKGKNLKAENATIKIAGSGDASVFASENLDVKISGSGNVEYIGSPNIDQKISGSGTIKPIKE